MIVDTHVHVVAEDQERYPFAPASDFRMGALGAWQHDTPVSAERLLREMAGANVDRAIVVQPFSAYGYDNSYHADSAARFSDRLAAVSAVDPLTEDAPRQLAMWVQERGMQGVRLTTNREGVRLDDSRSDPLWDQVRTLRIPVCVLTSPSHFGEVRTMAARFPEVPVALDHAGGIGSGSGQSRAAIEALLDLASLPNVYVKVSTVNFAPLRAEGDAGLELWRQIVAGFGARRLLWGSNYPVSQEGSYADMVDLGRQALPFLSESERDAMLAGTALSLWPRLAAPTR